MASHRTYNVWWYGSPSPTAHHLVAATAPSVTVGSAKLDGSAAQYAPTHRAQVIVQTTSIQSRPFDPFIGPFIGSFIGPLGHSLVHSLVHWSIQWFIHWSIHWSIRPFIGSLVHSLVHSSVHSLVHSLVHWSIHWFIHWSIGPFIGPLVVACPKGYNRGKSLYFNRAVRDLSHFLKQPKDLFAEEALI